MAQAIGAIIGFFSTVFEVGAVIGLSIFGGSYATAYIFGTLAVATVVAGSVMLLKTLAPKMPDLNALTSRAQNIRSPISTRKLIYGQIKVGGTLVFIGEGNTSTDRENLYILFALASHVCESIDKVWIANEECTLNGSGEVTSPTRYYVDSIYHAKFILNMLGSTTQEVNADIVSDTDLTATDHFKGITVAQCRLKYHKDGMWASGIPQLNFLVSGKKVYDPREGGQTVDDESTWEYSNNPALCVVDYIRSEFGLNVPHTVINWTTVTTASNVCDEDVSLDGGGTQKRYTCDGLIDTGTPIQNNIDSILSAMAGFMCYQAGTYSFFAGEYRSPSLTITEADLQSAISIQTKTRQSEQINTITGLFVGEDTNYQPASYPTITDSSYVTQDGQELKAEINLGFTNDSFRAQRIAKIFLERARQQYTMTLSLNLEKFTLSPGDTVKVTLDSLNFQEKVFEVVEWSFGIEGEGKSGAIVAVNVLLKETASSVYTWSSSEEQSQGTAPSLTPTYYETVTTPTFSLAQGQSKAEDGTIVDEIVVDITDSSITDPHVQNYTVYWKENSEGSYKEVSVERES